MANEMKWYEEVDGSGMAIGMEFKMDMHKYLHISLSTSKTFSMRAGQGKMRENPKGRWRGRVFGVKGKQRLTINCYTC